MIEALVALAVVAVSITAIGSVVATNIRGTGALGQRLALVETTRAILTDLPDRQQLVSGSVRGEYAAHRWQVDVLPFVADFIDPGSWSNSVCRRATCPARTEFGTWNMDRRQHPSQRAKDAFRY